MAFEVTMPRLGWSMEVGMLAEWRKKDGDRVEAGEILFAVEGDKAIQDVEALESGILRIPPDSLPTGQELPVGAVLAYIVQPGEATPFENETGVTPAAAVSESAGRVQATPPPVEHTKNKLPAISPRARRVAEELGVNWTALKGSGRIGRIVERDVRQAAEAKEAEVQIKVSPVARRLAEEAGVDLAELAAHKPGVRIQREDVEAAVAARQMTSAPLPAIPTEEETIPVTQMRRIIAQRMAESSHTAAAVTLTTEADVTELVTLREQIKATLSARELVAPTYTDLLVKLTGVALKEHPMLNAYWKLTDSSAAEDKIVIPTQVHIAVAVDTKAGLLVPVIHDIPAKSIQAIAEEARDLAEKARARQLGPDELQGATFTITNLGTYGIDAFTPIINLPQCAILGVGRIIEKPAVVSGQIVPRKMMALSLTFDHRVVDGGPAARFLNTVREYVEQPYQWLTR